LAENFDQRCRKIACRQKTELSKEIEETVSFLTKEKDFVNGGNKPNITLKKIVGKLK